MSAAAPGLLADQSIVLQERLARARSAQQSWAELRVKDRLSVVRRFRHLLASEADTLTGAMPSSLSRSSADTLTAEVLPLAEAAKFLEREASALLAPAVTNKRGRPFWLSKVQLTVQRDALGVVMIIAPSNYPLFLPGVQTLQALVAGNAVFWKPGAGGLPVAQVMADLLTRAGLPDTLLNVTADTREAAIDLLQCGPDKVVITGSEASGRAVLHACADRIIPATVELSGCDSLFVLKSANLKRSVDALLFGLRFNGSATCIAPRRVFVQKGLLDAFTMELRRKLHTLPPVTISAQTKTLVEELVNDALRQSAKLLTGPQHSAHAFLPVVLTDTEPHMQLMKADVFAPIAGICAFETEAEALRLAAECPFALGATVFGRETQAIAFAQRVRAGVVTVNDLIVPTADPRLSFGGLGRSGFGKTRGREGLLEMTVTKTLAVQRAKRLRHLEPPHPQAQKLFSSFLLSLHGRGWKNRTRGVMRMAEAVRTTKSELQN